MNDSRTRLYYTLWSLSAKKDGVFQKEKHNGGGVSKEGTKEANKDVLMAKAERTWTKRKK